MFSKSSFALVFFLLLLAAFSFSFIACEINESDEIPLGAAFIAAHDTINDTAIINAQILIDGQPQSNDTPALIEGLEQGDHQVEVRPSSAYSPKTVTFTVTPPDTSEITVNFAPSDDSGTLTINSNENGAIIIVDDLFINDAVTPHQMTMAPGYYNISVFMPGYKTATPSMIMQLIEPYQEYTINFTLEALASGNTIGSLVPDFKLRTDEGEEDSLSIGQFRGRVVLINFWYRFCENCREEFPGIQQVYEDRSPEGFRVVGINTNWSQDEQEIFDEFRTLYGLTFPLLYVPGDASGHELVWNTFNVHEAPVNIIIDQEGVIQYRFGAVSQDDLNNAIDELLGL